MDIFSIQYSPDKKLPIGDALNFVKEKITAHISMLWIFCEIDVEHVVKMMAVEFEKSVIFEVQIEDLLFGDAFIK